MDLILMKHTIVFALLSAFLFSSCILGGALTEEQAAQVSQLVNGAVAGMQKVGGITGIPGADLALTGIGAALAAYKGTMLKRDAARRARIEPVTVAEATAARR